MKETIARAIVDREFRKNAFGDGGDLPSAIAKAGYVVDDDEVKMLSCNTEKSFDENLVTMDNMMEYWDRSETRLISLTSGVAASTVPKPSEPAG
jgi:hypothetical protein